MKRFVLLAAILTAFLFGGVNASAYDDHTCDIWTLSYPPTCLGYDADSPVAYFKDADGELPPTHAGDYRYIISTGGWNDEDFAGVPSQTPVLAYMSAISCREGGGFHYGVTAEEARSNGWILLDEESDEMVNTNFPDSKICDPADANYQAEWIAQVEALLDEWDADGVFIDDFLREESICSFSNPPTNTDPCVSVDYDTQAEWQTAMLDFASTVGPELESNGYRVVFNANGRIDGDGDSDTGANEIEWHTAIEDYSEAAMTEWCQHIPEDIDANTPTVRKSGSAWYQNWEGWQSAQEDSADRQYGLLCMENTNQANPQLSVSDKRYILQSFLLDWNGHDGAFVAHGGTGDPWIGAMGNAIALGHPVESKHLESGVWIRDFENGHVEVNPSAGTGSIVLDP